MELRHMRYFVAVAEEGSFRRGAERLGMEQPPLSRQIQDLERELGVRLLDRTPKGAALTPAGRAFLTESRKALAQVERAGAAARRAGGDEPARLSIGFTPFAYVATVAPQMARIEAALRGADLTLVEACGSELVPQLEGGELDGAFVHAAPNARKFRARLVHREPLVAALPADHPQATERAIDLGVLANERFVLPPLKARAVGHRAIVGACRVAGFEPREIQVAAPTSLALGLVRQGRGVSLVGRAFAATEGAGVAYVPLRGEPLVLDTYLAWRRGLAGDLARRFDRLFSSLDNRSVEAPSDRSSGGGSS